LEFVGSGFKGSLLLAGQRIRSQQQWANLLHTRKVSMASSHPLLASEDPSISTQNETHSSHPSHFGSPDDIYSFLAIDSLYRLDIVEQHPSDDFAIDLVVVCD
jgi:hypothetical protein